MKDLQKYYWECLDELSSINITPGNIKKVVVNYRSKNRWGLCKHEPDGHIIEISNRLLTDEVNEVALKNTIIHEILHTVEGTKGHKGLWKELAEKVNKELGYNIKRTTSSEEKGLSAPIEKINFPYIISCPHCGWKEGYQRNTKVIQFTEKYRCGKCKTKLIRIK